MASKGPASLLFFKQILHPASGCREVLAAEQAVAFHSEAVTAQLQHLPPGPGTKVLLTAVVFAHSLSSAQGPLCSSQKEVPVTQPSAAAPDELSVAFPWAMSFSGCPSQQCAGVV